MSRTATGRKSTFQKLASFRLDLLARLSERHADVTYRRKVGLGILQCRVLGIVGSNGEMSFKAICRETGIEKSHASRIVASLIELGLFHKAADPSDQRSIILKPTASGRKTHKQVLLIALERNDRWLEALSAEQRDVFLHCMDLLTQQARKLAIRIKAPEPVARSKTRAIRSSKARRRPGANLDIAAAGMVGSFAGAKTTKTKTNAEEVR